MADINGALEVDGLVKQRKELDDLLTDRPEMEKKVQGIIRKVLTEVRKRMSQEAKSTMKSDPRRAYKAVKMAVYRRILGGSVSIMPIKKAGAPSSYEPPRKLRPGQRGGNRVTRSERTKKFDTYEGVERGFILRFLNAGTDEREAGTRGGKLTGNRGSIQARNWFGPRSHAEMQAAAANLELMIDDLIKSELL